MSDNIAKLIQDIDKLDGHGQNMMEELKVLRDITGRGQPDVPQRTTPRGLHGNTAPRKHQTNLDRQQGTTLWALTPTQEKQKNSYKYTF